MMLDSEAVLAAIIACAPANMEISADPSLRVDPQAEAYVEGVRSAHDAVKALAEQPAPEAETSQRVLLLVERGEQNALDPEDIPAVGELIYRSPYGYAQPIGIVEEIRGSAL
jgi:hypothetical protein